MVFHSFFAVFFGCLLSMAPFLSCWAGEVGAGDLHALTASSQLGISTIPLGDILQDGLGGAKFESVIGAPPGITVSNRGSSSFNYPFKLPPGRQGMTPSVSITCDSHMENDLLGMRCGLAYGAVIQRFDNGKAPLFNANATNPGRTFGDHYAFNPAGASAPPFVDNELMMKSGIEYRTRRESWIKFEPSNDHCGAGPCFWKATAPDGMVTFYGGDSTCHASAQRAVPATNCQKAVKWDFLKHSPQTQHNEGIVTWYPTRQEDLHGNTIEYEYANWGWVPYLKKISYTKRKTGASGSFYTVNFFYPLDGYSDTDNDVRPDVTGGQVNLTKLLKKIKILAGATLVREYRVTYEQDGVGTGRSRIYSIRELGSDATGPNFTAAPPITFSWSDNNPDDNPPFTQDSFEVYAGLTGTLAELGDYSNLMGITEDDYPLQVVPGDVDGDGDTDVVVLYKGALYDNTVTQYDESRGRNQIYLYRAENGDLAAPELITRFPVNFDFRHVPTSWQKGEIQIFLVDVNGDGIKDLVTVTLPRNTHNDARFYTVGDHEEYRVHTGQDPHWRDATVTVQSLTNAVLLQDTMTISIPEHAGQAPGDRTNVFPVATVNADIGRYPEVGSWDALALDRDSDGKTDITLLLDLKGTKEVFTLLGSNVGFQAVQHQTLQAPFFGTAHYPGDLSLRTPMLKERVVAADINGDGFSDMVYTLRHVVQTMQIGQGGSAEFYLDSRWKAPGLAVGYSLGSATGFSDFTLNTIDADSPAGFTYELLLEDFNLDHRADIGLISRGVYSPEHINMNQNDFFQAESTPGHVITEENAGDRVAAFQELVDMIGEDTDLGSGFFRPRFFNMYQLMGFPEEIANNQGAHKPFALAISGTQSIPHAGTVKPGFRAWSNPSATYENHTGDINGDGRPDFVSDYAGAFKFELQYALANEQGYIGQLTTWNGDIGNGTMLDQDGTNFPCDRLDGIPINAKGHAGLTDLNGDRRMDWYYVSSPEAGGFTKVCWLLGTGYGFDHKMHFKIWANNYGRSDIVVPVDLFGHGISSLVTFGRDPTVPVKVFKNQLQQPDQIVRVENGFGGTTTVSSLPASQVQNAMKADMTTLDYDVHQSQNLFFCDAPSSRPEAFSPVCGGVNNFPRPLVTSIETDNGFAEDDPHRVHRKTEYSYDTCRYLHAGKTNSADLGCFKFGAKDAETGVKSETTFFVSKWFNGLEKSTEAFDASNVRLSASEEDYELIEPFARPSWSVRPTHSTSTQYEGAAITSTASKTLTYQDTAEPYSKMLVRQAESCVGSDCTTTITNYTHFPSFGFFGRVDEVKQVKPDGNILGWTKNEYSTNAARAFWKLERVKSLLCPLATNCQLQATGAWPTGTRWVIVKNNVQYDYDVDPTHSFGNVRSFRNQAGALEEVVYDPSYYTLPISQSIQVEQLHANPQPTSYKLTKTMEYYPLSGGLVKTAIGFNGDRTVYTYDKLGRVTEVDVLNGTLSNSPVSRRMKTSYLDFGDVHQQRIKTETKTGTTTVTIRDPIPRTQTLELWTKAEKNFDGFGRGWKTVNTGEGGDAVMEKTESFDRVQHLRTVRYTDPFIAGTAQNGTMVRFDGRGRPLVIAREAAGTNTLLRQYVYGPQDGHDWPRAVGIIDAKNHKTLYNFDDHERLTHVIDSKGQEMTYHFDVVGNVDQVYLPHDALNLAQRTIGFAYDSAGRAISKTDPWTGTMAAQYWPEGQVYQVTSANNHVVRFWYDTLGRLRQKQVLAAQSSHSNDDASITLPSKTTFVDYDQGTNGKGHVASVLDYKGGIQSANLLSRYNFVYDLFGNLTSKTSLFSWIMDPQQPTLWRSFTETYVYDLIGRPTSVTVPDNLPIANDAQNHLITPSSTVLGYGYTSAGNLETLTRNTNVLGAFEYNVRNQLTTQTVARQIKTLTYRDSSNSVIPPGMQDNFLDSMWIDGPNGELMSFRYHYDEVHNITQIEDLVDSAATQNFSYDELDRLLSAHGAYGDEAYRYNEIGDMRVKGNNVFI
ncbi:MAG: RHS repeat protein, partial [Deltaproteobacteria bacterium]|nr:RHS repeat protein [Deltaproteobacteria bacterium]